MDRRGEFLEAFMDEMPQEMQNVDEKILFEFEARQKEITAEFLAAVDQALTEYSERQAVGEKGALECILISPACYGINTGSYEVTISALDQRMYFDPEVVMSYWQADFVYHHIDDFMKILPDFFKKHFIRVKEYELEEFRQIYALGYQGFLFAPLLLLTARIPTLESYQRIKHAKEVWVLYGLYMEQGELMHAFAGEGSL